MDQHQKYIEPAEACGSGGETGRAEEQERPLETLCLPESLELRMVDGRLTLTDGTLSLYGDFTRMIPRLRQGNLQGEFIVKAARLKDTGQGEDSRPTVVDATAGLGEDSLLLAASGFQVILYEYDPVIAALLRDTLRRGAEIPELAEAVGRMELREEDSICAMQQMGADGPAPDVILLDPMFPERQKSALVKKKFQLLQKLERPCAEEEELLAAALAAAPRKIVIKRPRKGPQLAGVKPTYSIPGKAIRYDCIVLR